ncbi:MAG: MFS transporter [Promethearchaeota archaeon]
MNNAIEEESFKDDFLKVDIKQTLFIAFGFLSAMIAWSFYNFKIPIILNGIMGAKSGTWIRVGMLGKEPYMEIVGGALMTLDNIIAILLQPYFGKLSDHLESKYGRRSPFFIIGLPTAVFCLFILPFMPLIGLFIAVIVVFNLAMAFYRPAVMSLMPDKTPPQNLSIANSFISLMGGIGFVIGMLIPTTVEQIPGTEPTITGNYETQDFFWQDFWGFFLTGFFMLLCLIVFLWKVKEVPTGDKFFHVGDYPIQVDVYSQKIIPYENGEKKEERKIGIFDEWHEILKDEDKSALWVLLAVFAYLFGFNALEYSFGRFGTSYLQISEGTTSLLIAILPITLILFAIPAGSLATKYGRLLIMKVGLVIMGSCCVGIIIVLAYLKPIVQERPLTMLDLLPLIILLSIAGIGYGFTHINALPVVWQLAPKDKIGSYTGVYYMISALGSILSPLVMSSLFSIIRYSGGDQWVALFPYYLVGVIMGYFCVIHVKKGDAVPLTPEELAELRALYMAD